VTLTDKQKEYFTSCPLWDSENKLDNVYPYINIHSPIDEYFTRQINHISKFANISNATLAKDLKVSKSTISRWKSGKSIPKLKNRKAIFERLQTIATNEFNKMAQYG
jgi:ribosome-binding protein aMBF1 (putative translation factor)